MCSSDLKKMSKSLGNFFTVRDLLEQGVPGEVIRFVMLGTQYGKPMDWTERKREEAERMLDYFYEAVGDEALDADIEPDGLLVEALSRDLNTKIALDQLHGAAVSWHVLKEGREATAKKLKKSASLLGLLGMTRSEWLAEKAKGYDLSVIQTKLSRLREAAMASKDFTAVDVLKTELAEAGVEVRISKVGVELVPAVGFNPAKLEALK